MMGRLVLVALALACFAAALYRGRGVGIRALRETRDNLVRIMPMMLVAMPMATFLAELIPADIAAGWLGPESGVTGLLVASLAGGLIPGGPYASFPLVLTFLKAGAGPAQMVTLITGWAVLAFHRMVMWEVPVLGVRFALVRVASSLALPLLAGLLAEALLPLFPHLVAGR
jgi:uncharacterized membrane protein YraQ (UPF0718 family)